MGEYLYKHLPLSEPLIRDLYRLNPWWDRKPQQVLPPTRRHLVGQIQRRLDRRLAPIIVVRGPRQIGKTTAQLQVLSDLLAQGVSPRNILRLQADELPELISLSEPIVRIVDWYEGEVLRGTLNEVAHRGERTYLFFDEVQNLKAWETQLKMLVDTSTTQVVVTGSSALRIELGRDSLAGRINTIEAGVLSLTETAKFLGEDLGDPFLADNGLEPLVKIEFWRALADYGRRCAVVRDRAFRAYSQRGGYPLAQQRQDIPWSEVADQLNETVIKRVIQHDLRVGDRGRKRDAALLEELYRLVCRYAGQSPDVQLFTREVGRALRANIGPQRVRQYLRFLHDTLLVRLIEPLEIRLKRKRGSAKLCLADHGLRASWLQEMVPLDPDELAANADLTTLAGHIAESVAGASLATISGLDLAYVPARGGEPEIDFVLTVGTRRVPLEVKYQRRIDAHRDTEGLRSFIERTANNAGFGVLVTQSDTDIVLDPRIVALPLSTMMLLR